MQDGTVGWDPISVRPVFSWQERVFVLYCLLVVGVAVVRSISLARQLWFGGLLAKGTDVSHARFRFVWEICNSKVVGMRRLAAFTALSTFLLFADRVTNFLRWTAIEKQIGIAAASGTGAQIGAFVVLGLVDCAVLYACAEFYEGALARRMAHWTLSRERQAAPNEVGPRSQSS